MFARRSSAARWLVLASLVAAGDAAAQTKTFTKDADFDSGSINNVRHTPVADQLVLGRTPVSQTRLVWVSNTAPGGSGATPLSPGWILRVNTTPGANLGKQTARFDSVLTSIGGTPTGAPASGNNPGRVAVDTRGDVWIVNRAYYEGAFQGSLSKFSGNLAHCIDRNNNGVIDTSYDANGDGIIDPYKSAALGTPAAQIEYFGQADECILTTIKIGVPGDIPRAVAVDRAGKIWVATWQGHTLYRFNPNEPVALEASRVFTPSGSPAFPTTTWFYSAATADDGIYLTSNPGWASSSGSGQVIRVDINNINNATAVTCGGGSGTCGSVYGIVAIPGTRKAWAGGYSGTGVYKVDFDASPATCTCVSVPSTVTAVTYDLNGKIWAAGYSSGSVYRINPTTNAIEATCPTGGASPHGLSVDFDGYIWSVQDGGPNTLVRFDPVATASNCGRTSYAIDRGGLALPAGQSAYNYGPYLYSDFTGTQIDRQAPYTYLGSWDGTYDGGAAQIPWAKVAWNAEPQGAVPAQTSLKVSARAADSIAALGVAAYAPMTNGAAASGLVGRYVQVRADLSGPGWLTSVLSDVSVTGPCATTGPACCITSADCGDGNLCTADTCPTPGGACAHAAIPDCCNTAADCDDGNACTADSCPTAGALCARSPIAGCCNSNKDCDDANLCSADICSGPGGTCGHPLINGCCNTDVDCTKGNKCSSATCPTPGGFCAGGAIPGCCNADADCADTDLCTRDVCDTTTSTCSNAKVSGCCNTDAECFDDNACTADTCSGPGGTCVFSAIPGCCAAGDPKLGTPCDAPVSPFDKPPCKAGKLECAAGKFACVGAVKPTFDVCDGVDNNCDGVVDVASSCAAGQVCVTGVCVSPCAASEFPCKAGYTCLNGYCMPPSCADVTCPSGSTCVDGECRPDGDAGPDGGTDGGTDGSTDAESDTGASDTGADAADDGAVDATFDGGDAATPDAPTESNSGCGCEVAGEPRASLGLGLGAALLAATGLRRRRGRRGGAGEGGAR